MIKAGLSVSLVVCLTLPALAANEPEKDKTREPSVLPVRELLERVAKSPLGLGEAGLLRAVADVIEKEVEKEQVAGADRFAPPRPRPAVATRVVPAPVQATPPLPAPNTAPVPQRKQLAIRLSHVPVLDAAKSLEQFLESEQKGQRSYENAPNPNRVVLVPEPVSNTLLISGTPKMVDSVTELVAKLDAPSPVVKVDMCIAELYGKRGDGRSDDSAMGRAPPMEKDGAAWLAWVKKHGRLEVLGRPQIMTLNNQRALITIGQRVRTGVPEPGAEGPAKGNQVEQAKPGLTVGLTPRISPEGLVVMELDVEVASVVSQEGATGPSIGKTTVQTTISAKDGRTVVLGGPLLVAEDGQRQLVIALTPRVNPPKR